MTVITILGDISVCSRCRCSIVWYCGSCCRHSWPRYMVVVVRRNSFHYICSVTQLIPPRKRSCECFYTFCSPGGGGGTWRRGACMAKGEVKGACVAKAGTHVGGGGNGRQKGGMCGRVGVHSKGRGMYGRGVCGRGHTW